MSTTAGDISCSLNKQSSNLLAVLEKNPKRFQRIQFLARIFKDDGYELRIAGGAVRDILRGVEPQDIDFATTARPEQSLDILKKYESIVRIIVTAAGQKHGTVAVKFKEIAECDLKKIKLIDLPPKPQGDINNCKPEYDDESPYEITTLRCDTFTDGRHATVEFINDWNVDAERRDLTINAMFLTLDDGKLIDYFDGEADLKNGVVRFVGNAELRIKEDYLRILRYFRFWSRYGRNKQPDEDTIKTIERNLVGLDIISGERIWVEVKKIFSLLPCYEVTKIMFQVRLFSNIDVVDHSLEDYDDFVKKRLIEIEKVQENISLYSARTKNSPTNDKRLKDLLPVIMFATVVQSSELCLKACKRLKFSNIERDSILYIVENRTKTSSLDTFKYQLAMAANPDRPIILHKIKALLIYSGDFDLISELDSWTIPNFPMTGHVVAQEIKRRKLPGNKIKEILGSLKDDWAAAEYRLNEEELRQKLTGKLDNLNKSIS